MRKFVLANSVKYTDNDAKANQLLRLGYKEVADDGQAPGFTVQVKGEPRPVEEPEAVEVEKGLHTLAEPTTSQVEAAAVEPVSEDEPKKPARKTSK